MKDTQTFDVGALAPLLALPTLIPMPAGQNPGWARSAAADDDRAFDLAISQGIEASLAGDDRSAQEAFDRALAFWSGDPRIWLDPLASDGTTAPVPWALRNLIVPI